MDPLWIYNLLMEKETEVLFYPSQKSFVVLKTREFRKHNSYVYYINRDKTWA